jgi:hypothetical protein
MGRLGTMSNDSNEDPVWYKCLALGTIHEEYPSRQKQQFPLPTVLINSRDWQTGYEKPRDAGPMQMKSNVSKFAAPVMISSKQRQTSKDVDFECSVQQKQRQALQNSGFECSSGDVVKNAAESAALSKRGTPHNLKARTLQKQSSRGAVRFGGLRFQDMIWAICLPRTLMQQQHL